MDKGDLRIFLHLKEGDLAEGQLKQKDVPVIGLLILLYGNASFVQPLRAQPLLYCFHHPEPHRDDFLHYDCNHQL